MSDPLARPRGDAEGDKRGGTAAARERAVALAREAPEPGDGCHRVRGPAHQRTLMSDSIYPKQGSAFGLSASPSFPTLEQRILDFWDTDDTFRASVEARDAGEGGENEFVFYDGPPFANGLPHYGHLLTSYVKDVVPRYQTMRGKKVERRFGWDTHGLPAELEAMKQLGLRTKDEILEMGVGTFNEAARASVLRYTDE